MVEIIQMLFAFALVAGAILSAVGIIHEVAAARWRTAPKTWKQDEVAVAGPGAVAQEIVARQHIESGWEFAGFEIDGGGDVGF